MSGHFNLNADLTARKQAVLERSARHSRRTVALADRKAPVTRSRKFTALGVALTMLSTGFITGSGLGQSVAAPVGQGFTVTASDMSFILSQIKIAEHHTLTATPTNPCAGLLGTGPDQVPSPLIALGLRTIDGSCNNLQPGQEQFGAADQVFPRLTTPVFKDAEAVPTDFFGPGSGTRPTSYLQTKGSVFDTQPRLISNLIVDQTSNNPAAVAAAASPVRTQGNVGVFPCTAPNTPTPDCVPAGQTLFIPNVTTDVGLSPPYNSLFTIFGQFFDHGLDKITNGGSGTVFVPLRDDDPLIVGIDGIAGTIDDPVPGNPKFVPLNSRFMVLTRGRMQPGPDGIVGDLASTPSVDESADDIHEAVNTDSPWVDLSQAYASHSSHQVFLRQYALDANNHPQSTGKLLGNIDGSMANWGDVKAQARALLGLELVDTDVNNIPMIATDPYGNFIPGPNGLPQYVTTLGLVEGVRGVVPPSGVVPPGLPAPANVLHIDTAFLNDIAHSAAPKGVPDLDLVAGTSLTPANCTGVTSPCYDNELLDLHVIAGDGRANENIGLTTIHTIFEHEHNRLVGDEQNVLNANAGVKASYEATNCAFGCATNLPSLPTTFTYGQRLFQAARFVTEMEYQHLVFEEFARKVQPAINPFNLFAFSSTATNPAIKAEFAHAVYRFGHSMLDETIPRTNVDGTKNDIALLDGFLNPAEFKNVTVGDLGAASGDVGAAGAGAIVMGLSDQVGNELDEFVSDTLRNNLLGLPLDLASLNLTRARSEGIPSLNNLRKDIFAQTGDGQLTPYTDWVDFGLHLKHPESLINFVAAYGQHPTITAETTLIGKRAAARAIVQPTTGDVQPPDAAAFMFSMSYPGVAAVAAVPGVPEVASGPGPDGIIGTDCGLPTASPECTDNPPPATPAIQPIPAVAGIPAADWSSNANGVSATGLDSVDLWVGGLAEITDLFGGLLGSTFNYVFELQLTQLQDNDRLYYLNRTPGMNLRAQLEGNSFAELVMRNTTATTLKADAFATADCKFEIGNLTWPAAAGSAITGVGSVNDDPSSGCDENALLIRTPSGQFRYRPVNSVDPTGINGQSVYNGTAGVDRVAGGNDNDTILGNEGNDVLEGNGGDDDILGGDGNDIVTDTGGADTLKGGPGNDALDGGIGLDLLLGGDGVDFTVGGANTNVHFAGPGNDFILAGQGADEVDGDSGDDWMQGGDQTDLLQGDSGSLFFDDHNKPGSDIMIGQAGDDDYDMEGGDDIGVAGPGIEKNAGGAGWDWSIGLGDPQPQDADLALPIIGVPLLINGVRDKFNEVESLSGWNFNDVLHGDNIIPSQITGGGFIGCDALDQASLDRISGLDALVPPLTIDSAPIIAASVTRDCPLVGPVWGEGNILLGGGGSDVIEGRGGNDIIDGDRYLSVRLSVRDTITNLEIGSTDLLENKAVSGNFGTGTTGMTLQQAVFAGLVDPGQIVAVREIITPPVPQADCGAAVPLNCDTALFSGPASSYFIRPNPDGSVDVVAPTVVAGGVRISDGTDTLRNIENLRFCEQFDALTKTCLTFSNQTIGAKAVADQTSLTFGNQLVGTASATQTIRVSNIGNLDLVFAPITKTGPDAASFNVLTDCAVLSPFNGSCGVVVTFNPLSAGAKSATINIFSNDPASPLTISVTGTGVDPAPVLTQSVTSLSFGNQTTNTTSAAQNVIVTNTGNADLIVSGISLTGLDAAAFTGATACGTVIPGGTCTIAVTFRPTTVGVKAATLSINSNSSVASATVALSGTGTALVQTTASIASIVVGRIRVGTSIAKTALVTNTGTRPLIITGATVGAPFSVSLGTCAAQVLPGRTCKLNVTFTPTAVGVFSRPLTLTSNASNNPTATVSGTGR